jgi:hypothetical protein
MFGRKSLPAIEKQETVSGADDQPCCITSRKVVLGPKPNIVVMYEEGRVSQLHVNLFEVI